MVLTYHRIATDDAFEMMKGLERKYAVSQSNFTAQLDLIRDLGFTFIDLDKFHKMVCHHTAPDQPSLLLTFDDGYESLHSVAMPMLTCRGVPGVVYVTTHKQSPIFCHGHFPERRLSDRQILDLERANLRVGAHGLTHCPLPSLSDSDLDLELTRPIDQLSKIVERPVLDLAIPLNLFDDRVMRRAKEVGYRTVTVNAAGMNGRRINPHWVRRVGVNGTMEIEDFRRVFCARGRIKLRIIGAAKRIPPRLIGCKRWLKFRSWFFQENAYLPMGTVLKGEYRTETPPQARS